MKPPLTSSEYFERHSLSPSISSFLRYENYVESYIAIHLSRTNSRLRHNTALLIIFSVLLLAIAITLGYILAHL